MLLKNAPERVFQHSLLKKNQSALRAFLNTLLVACNGWIRVEVAPSRAAGKAQGLWAMRILLVF
jgi:hypothetical protein